MKFFFVSVLVLGLFWIVFGTPGGPKSYSQYNETHVFVASPGTPVFGPEGPKRDFRQTQSLAKEINFSDPKWDPMPSRRPPKHVLSLSEKLRKSMNVGTSKKSEGGTPVFNNSKST